MAEPLFPQFPTSFLPEDVERLRELADQRRAMEEAYRVKFAQSSWEALPIIERKVREFAHPLLTSVIEALPGRAETLEFGFTPEQFQESLDEVEEEFKELTRKQKVTGLLPGIQSDIMIAALSREPILGISELLSTFPELRIDFSEEEVNYLARLSQVLSQATPEQIMSGELFAYEPGQLPFTEEDYNALFNKGITDPRQLFAVVEFAKNLEDVTLALREAYPAETSEEEASEALRTKLRDFFKQRNEELGITPEGEIPTKKVIQELHSKIAEEAGESLVLVDEEGVMFPAKRMTDNSIWIGEDLVGFQDEQGNIVPIAFDTEPILSDVTLADKLKLVGDRLYKGGVELLHSGKQVISSVLPLKIFSNSGFSLEEQVKSGWITKEQAEEIKAKGDWRPWADAVANMNEKVVEAFTESYQRREAEHRVWLEEHPALIPPPEWEGRIIDIARENPKVLTDPLFIAYVASESTMFTAAFLSASISVGLLTKNPAAGMAAGVVATTPFESKQLFDELLLYTSPEQAADLAITMGAIISSVEVLGGMPLLKAAIPSIFRGFRRGFTKELVKLTFRQMALKGLKTFTTIEVMEAVEEVIQDAIHNATIKWFDETKEIFRDVPEIVARTMLSTLGFAVGGTTISTYHEFKVKLPPDVQQEVDENITKMEEAGLPTEQAQLTAMSQVMETETGQVQVEEAVEAAEEQIPSVSSSSYGEFLEWMRGLSPELQKSLFPVKDFIDLYSRLAVEGTAFPNKQVNELFNMVSKELIELKKSKAKVSVQTKRIIALIDEAISKPTRLNKVIAIDSYVQLMHGVEDFVPSSLVVPPKAGVIEPEVYSQALKDIDKRIKTILGELASGDFVPVSEKVTKLDSRLASYIEDIETTKSSIDIQKARLEKMKIGGELPSEQLSQVSLIQNLEERLVELERDKKAVQKKAQKANKEVLDATEVPESVSVEQNLASWERYKADRIAEGITPEELAPINMTIRDLQKKRGRKAPIDPGVAETPQVEAVSNETATQQVIAPYLVTDPLIHERRPRTIEWELEQEDVEQTLANPDIAEVIKIPKEIRAIRVNAETVINRLQSEYKAAKKSKDKDAIKTAENRIKSVAKDAGLSKKELLGKGWDDLPPDSKIRLAISLIPDKSLKFHGIREGFDMEYFMEFLEEMTGAPFYSILRRMEAAGAATETEKEIILKRITTDPFFKDIRTNDEALARVAQEINARNEVQGIEHPEDVSENEMLLADAIEDVYNAYKPIVRYLRVMRTDSDIESFKKEFPDAVEAGKEVELELAIKLKEEGNLDDLWAYLFTLDWGVIEHGFDPRLIASPGLKIRRRGGLHVTRGKGRLLRRESIEYPAGKMGMNVLARLASYIEQMEIQWRIEPEVDVLSDYWDMVGDKFEDWGQIEKGLETWLERVQNIGLGYNWADRQVRKLWRQSMVSVFLEVFMSFRNSFQAIVFHTDRTELFRIILDKLPADVSEKGNLYFETFVSQLGGLRRDWLHVGETGFLIPEWWNRLADSLSLYGKSDYYPRLWSFKAALNKAQRATKDYTQHKNIDKWVKDSGAIHLRVIERNYAISHYLGQFDKMFNLDVPGLHEVSGADMTNFYVAQRIADITHFKYRRSSRGLIEMGKTGTTLWNLIVFPRGYSQRLYFQAEKIKNAFSGETTWDEARGGFNDIMKLVVVSLLFDELFKTVSGRRFNPYFVMNILFGWQFGGLFVGIAKDLSVTFGDIMVLVNPFAEEERKDIALSRLPTAIERLGDTLIPFYRRAWDVAEASLGREHLDRNLLRKVRGLLDKGYTPQELDEIDRKLWEKIRKGVLGGEVQDPTKLQAAMERIDEAQTRLGTIDITGRYYTVGDFGGEIASTTKSIPNILITEQEGFAPMVLFYKDSEAQWEELFNLPANDKVAKRRGLSTRDEWRKEHILEEAMLLFWEKFNKSVFILGTPEANEVKALLQMWFDLYGIDRAMHGKWSDWTLPVEIPLPEES